MIKNLLFIALTLFTPALTPSLFAASAKAVSPEMPTRSEHVSTGRASKKEIRTTKRWNKRLDRLEKKIQKKMDRFQRKGKPVTRLSLGFVGVIVLLIGGLFIALGLVIPAVGVVFLVIGIIIAFVGLLLWLLLGGIGVEVS